MSRMRAEGRVGVVRRSNLKDHQLKLVVFETFRTVSLCWWFQSAVYLTNLELSPIQL